jgi:tryptophanyl-tRNA synthetase
MSKSYGNTIEIFLPPKKLRKKFMGIVTDSKGVDESKDPDTCNVFNLYKLFATKEQQEDLAARYRAGGLGYGHAKQELFEVVDAQLAEPRERYEHLKAHPEEVRAVLDDGASRARKTARSTMDRVRSAVGL